MTINSSTLPAGPAATEEVSVDLCVVGGGIAGVCAAIAAARNGARTVILQDRPVFGGNASSEVRMWISGAYGADNKEAGLLEELQLANQWLNPNRNYPLWDVVLHGAVRDTVGLTAYLNCSVAEVEMCGNRIVAVRAWHLTRQRWIRVRAKYFADCSGDSVLRLSGAETRWGRESLREYDEYGAPVVADRSTMGNSLLLQLREIDPADHQAFNPPPWAHVYPADHHRLARYLRSVSRSENFWWLEIGGLQDTIADADAIRDELQRIGLGVWAWIKNHPDGRGRSWELEWFGSLPGKRENVRYIGDHLLVQADIEACGQFDDVVAHGGWPMDDHPPAAFEGGEESCINYPTPSPYGIPFRSLYSRNIDNLFFAGRNISATHMAIASTRVMGTCALLGQAIGTAAAIAVNTGASPRGVYQYHLRRLQATLMDDDQWLPGRRRSVPALTRSAVLSASAGNPEALRDGVDRRQDGDWHGWLCAPGSWAMYRLPAPALVVRVRLVLDSMLHMSKAMPCSYPNKGNRVEMPCALPRDFRIQVLAADGNTWKDAIVIRDNHRRLVRFPVDEVTEGVRLVVDRTWGGGDGRVFSFEIGAPVLDGECEPLQWPSTAVNRPGRRGA